MIKGEPVPSRPPADRGGPSCCRPSICMRQAGSIPSMRTRWWVRIRPSASSILYRFVSSPPTGIVRYRFSSGRTNLVAASS